VSEFERYSRIHRQFLTTELPPLLEHVAAPGRICDLGCGDGAALWGLHRRGLLDGGFAVDLSPDRVRAAAEAVPDVQGVVADATATGLPGGCADGVIAAQLIEHLPDDKLLAPELARLLRPGGWWYVGSVIKLPRGWWVYKVDGERRLDPTHVREYENAEQLLAVLRHSRLSVGRVMVTPMRFAVADLLLRALVKVGVLSPKLLSNAYRRSRPLRLLRRLKLRVPGYELVEVSGQRLPDKST